MIGRQSSKNLELSPSNCTYFKYALITLVDVERLFNHKAYFRLKT